MAFKKKNDEIALDFSDQVELEEISVRETFGTIKKKNINLSDAQPKELSKRWNLITNYAWELHPEYKVPRAIIVLEQLFKLATVGDIDAIKLFLDRVIGKQPDTLLLGSSLDQKDDVTLLLQVQQLVASQQSLHNSAQPPHNQNGKNKQNTIIDGDKPENRDPD